MAGGLHMCEFIAPPNSIHAFADWTDAGWHSMVQPRSIPLSDEFETFPPADIDDCRDGSEQCASCGNFDTNRRSDAVVERWRDVGADGAVGAEDEVRAFQLCHDIAGSRVQ